MKFQSRAWFSVPMFAVVACIVLAGASAVAAEGEEDKWEFFAPMYIWLAGIDGDITIRGRSANLDVDISEVLDHTDISFQGYFELRKKKFGFYANPTYLQLSASEKDRNTKVSLDQDLTIVDFGAFYNVGEWFEERPVSLDVYGGGRYWNISTDGKLNNSVVPFIVKRSGSTELIDPVIGLRAKFRPIEKLFLTVRGDIGGFNISEGTTSKFSWQAAPLVGYDFNKYFSVFAGYRWLGIDTDEKSGAKEHGFDVTLSGPQFGFNFDFFTWWHDRRK